MSSSPSKASPTLEKIADVIIAYNSIYFESYKIEKNENKFYILPGDWAGYSFGDKKDTFDMAATAAALERMKKYPGKSYSKKPNYREQKFIIQK